jgi:eukaryotic-like serine/threonine-protein kinase
VGFSRLRTDIGVATDPPRTLGRYELLGSIGVGGMATVYLARTAGEAGFQRLFAVKILHPHLAGEPGFITMLLDEARIAALLHHPNVVPIIDLGSQDGIHYVAMEYIEGCSLSALLKKRRDARPPSILVPLMIDALAGLESAHALVDDDGNPMNLVHRDVSPQNILVSVDGNARITDFGIARAESRINSTRPGQVKGKYAYMSPEQIRSSSTIDRRSDVFAAGGVLWSMLTGRKLFQGENDAGTMNNIMEAEVPPPSTIGLKPPVAFDAVCLRALERDPDKRYATAQEMEDALRDAAMSSGGLASRREISAWVGESFKEELSARRAAIRAAVSDTNRAIGKIPGIRTTAEFPGLLPRDGADTPVPTPPSTDVSNPPEYAMISVSTAGADKKRRLAAFVAIPAVCILALVVWFATRSSGATDVPAAVAPVAPQVTQPEPSLPTPASASTTPPIETPSAAPEPSPKDRTVAEPEETAKDTAKKTAKETKPTRVSRPAPIHHNNKVVHATPPPKPPEPAPVAKASPPPPLPPVEPPVKAPKQVRWDRDSPAPPP